MSPATFLGPLPFIVSMSGCASTTGPSADAVTEIRQERDCSGCETGSVVTLRRGGAATLVQTGKARFGTTDRSFTGAVSAADFERLAALLAARGFFEMRDEYRDPDLADGAWVTTTAVADGRTKNVFDGNEAGPAPLREIEDAIEALRARIDWVPVPP